MIENYFLNMIKQIREQEEIMLYCNLLEINEADAAETLEYLQKAYKFENISYPFSPPAFNDAAALWAAKTAYVSAQLILYRENKSRDLAALLPPYSGEINASAMVSADLCLRFFPDMLVQLKIIDSEDELISVMENILIQWHFSGVAYTLETENLNFDVVSNNKCLQQLYMNRIIEYKKINLAKHPACSDIIHANMGMFGETFWKDFKLETI